MQLLAPAKINLSLKILRRRADGFHEIETLMTPITLADELAIEPNESKVGIRFSCDDPGLPAGEENLVVRATRRFFEEIRTEPRVRIVLRKKIPHGAGLGGGSSDAASTLMGLNELFGAPLAMSRLMSLAAEIGSDIAFFLAGGAARCRGRGEIIESIARLPKLSFLLVKPQFGVSTSWAYRQWQGSSVLPDVDYSPQQIGELIVENDLERPVFEKYLFLANAKNWLRRQPEVAAAVMSGSGSTLFAVVRGGAEFEQMASRARRELDSRLWVWPCETL
jgi:4-diphosphocytidyl-2-C-methyl-D-erythritol kinase